MDVFRRQINPRRRAHAGLAGHRHSAPVIRDDAIHQGQSQPAMTFVFCGEKRLKNPRQHLRLNPAAVVGDLHAYISAGRQPHVAVLRRFGQLDVARLDGDLPLRRAGLEGVLDDFHERLLHLGLVKFAANSFRSNCSVQVIFRRRAVENSTHG